MITHRSKRRSPVARVAAIVGVGLLAVVAVAIVRLFQPGPPPSFEAAEFRAARAEEDTSVMQAQARLAVDQRALVGLPVKQLRAALGRPTRTYPRSARMVWQVGGLDPSGSPGTKLEVQLDRRMHHVVEARMDPRYD